MSSALPGGRGELLGYVGRCPCLFGGESDGGWFGWVFGGACVGWCFFGERQDSDSGHDAGGDPVRADVASGGG